MNKRPGQVRVTTEAGFCTFCGRVRNLRREEHQLGTIVRTVLTCETCHRTLSSTMGMAETQPEADAAAAAPVPAAPEPVATPQTAAVAKAKAAPKNAAASRKAPSTTSKATSKTRRK